MHKFLMWIIKNNHIFITVAILAFVAGFIVGCFGFMGYLAGVRFGILY